VALEVGDPGMPSPEAVVLLVVAEEAVVLPVVEEEAAVLPVVVVVVVEAEVEAAVHPAEQTSHLHTRHIDPPTVATVQHPSKPHLSCPASSPVLLSISSKH